MRWLSEFNKKRKRTALSLSPIPAWKNKPSKKRDFMRRKSLIDLTGVTPRRIKGRLSISESPLRTPRRMKGRYSTSDSPLRTQNTALVERTTRSDDKMTIDHLTLKAMENAFISLRPSPQSLYDIAMAISEDDAVLLLCSQNRTCTSSAKNRRRTDPGTKSLSIDDMFKNMGIKSPQDDREEEIKVVMTELANRVGSVERLIGDWKEMEEILGEVFDLTVERKEEEKKDGEASSNKKNTLKHYLEKLTKITQKKGIISPHERWQQIPFATKKSPTDSVETDPLEDLPSPPHEQLQKNDAKLQKIEASLQSAIDTLNQKSHAESEEAENLLLAKQTKPLFRPLSDEENEFIQNALYSRGSPAEIIASSSADSVTRESIQKLRPGEWLNDEIIHFFYTTLAKRDEESNPSLRSHFFKSFFLTKLLDEGGYSYKNVKRWSKRVPGKDIFKLDKIIIPVNVGNMHWCALVAFIQEKKIQFYDSMGGSGMRYLEGVMRYLKDEYKTKKNEILDESEWELIPTQPGTPRQENGFDCGVFSCMFADFISRDEPLNFSQDNVTDLRERIVLSIVKGIPPL